MRFAGAGFLVASGLLLVLTLAYVVVAIAVVKATTPAGSGALGPWLAFAPVIVCAGSGRLSPRVLTWTERYGWAAFQGPLATALGLVLMVAVTTTTDSLTLTALSISAGYALALGAAFVAVANKLGSSWVLGLTRLDFSEAILVPRQVLTPAIGQFLGGQALVVIERAPPLLSRSGVGSVSTLAYARGISAAPCSSRRRSARVAIRGSFELTRAAKPGFVRESFSLRLRTNLFVGCCFTFYFVAFDPASARRCSRGGLYLHSRRSE